MPQILGRRLRRSIQADVVIVGAGISGALLAHSLTEAGMRPLIVDRRRAALLGSTAASTALLQFELDTPLIHLSRTIGPRAAGRVWIASRDAVNELRTRSHSLKINAGLAPRPSLYLAGTLLDGRGLQKEARQRQRIGLPSEYLDRKALRRHFGIDREAALLSHGNAEANPVQLAAGYLRLAMKSGAKFHAPHDIENNRVLSTWAIATHPQPAAIWPQRALIWESSDPYLYLRSTADGRVICGGEDAEFSDTATRDERMGMKARRISTKLSRLMPAIDARPAYAWAGTFGANSTGMPTIGQVPGYPHCYAVMGYGGNGITFSMLASKLITAALLKRKLPEAPLFAFR